MVIDWVIPSSFLTKNVKLALSWYHIIATERPYEVWGGSHGLGRGQWRKIVWRGPVRKYVPNACSWELLVWSGVICGRFGVILEILECRITVCYKIFCQIWKRSNASAVSNQLHIVLSPNRFAFCTPLILTHSVILVSFHGHSLIRF